MEGVTYCFRVCFLPAFVSVYSQMTDLCWLRQDERLKLSTCYGCGCIPKYEHVAIVVLTLLCIELYALESVFLLMLIIRSCKTLRKH